MISEQDFFLNQNNITICYRSFGIPGNPSIVLITGIGGQLIHWPKSIIQGLVKKGFHVIIFDNRDMGLSRYYDDLPTPSLFEAIRAKQQGKVVQPPYTLHDMAADVITLMDSLHIKKAHIAGASMGGMIAQLVALNYPQRVLSLNCIATSSGDPQLPPAKPEVLEFFFSAKGPAQDVDSYIDQMMQVYRIYNHPAYKDEEIARELYRQAYLRAYHPLGFTRQFLAIIFSEPRGEKLKKLKLPSLVVHGDYDPVFPVEHAQYLAQCLANSHLEVIKNMGHSMPEFMHKTLVNALAMHLNH